jgi:hypothetical protein
MDSSALQKAGYDPADYYNPQVFENQNTGYRGIDRVSEFSGGGILPHQVVGNPNIWRIAAILDGDKDTRFVHTPTAAEIAALNFTMSFPHGLSFKPMTIGSFYTTASTARRQLPFEYLGDGVSYFGNKAGAAKVVFDKIDDTNIVIRVVILDAQGLSFVLSTSTFYFKFYCFQDGTI